MRKVSVLMAAVAVLVACGGFVAIGCGDDKAPAAAPVKVDPPKAAEPVKTDAPAKVEAPKAFSLEVTYTPVAGQSGGSIAGQVKVKDAPKRKKINMDADPKCAAMHAEKLLTEEVVADAEGNVQWAFVYIDKAPAPAGGAPKTPVTIDQKGCKYEPHVLGVMVGQEILIKNSDDLLHNIHALPFNNKEFNFGQPSKGMEEKKSFGTREVMVKIKCDVHPWMSAWAGVLDHPYFAVTDAAGKYEIKGVPAGKYVVKVWQEKYKDVSAEVEVKEGAAANKNFELADKKGD